MTFRERIPSILALQKTLGLGSYDKLHAVIVGKRKPSVNLAKRIEVATAGAIHWTEFFQDPEPAGQPSTPSLDEAI